MLLQLEWAIAHPQLHLQYCLSFVLPHGQTGFICRKHARQRHKYIYDPSGSCAADFPSAYLLMVLGFPHANVLPSPLSDLSAMRQNRRTY